MDQGLGGQHRQADSGGRGAVPALGREVHAGGLAGGDALIRRSIRELADELDPDRFVQIHRSVIVNLHHVAQVVRGANDTADVLLKGRPERLPVSRSYLHVFRQM
ncbi:LytTR family DNA-binding domain-containing protein [Aquincola sp. J276]|uniref:LytTR family DNA-binding domain-containing protein n=1 Tax=Aquincola sp. J276 TaxID=2898432 RepID=UPI0028735E3C|nr:LytTR family DNA-binding domain-containing protein [Aquincola sp. J276]